MTKNEMISEAKLLAANSYSPYSHFRVAAIIEDIDGETYAGVNVENSSYGMTMCAERAALFAAVTAGAREFTKMVIYSPDGSPVPCGACRQVLWEFCDSDFIITVAAGGLSHKDFLLGELLPEAFQL